MNNLSSFRHRVKVTLNAERTEDEVLAELSYLKNRVDLTHNLVAQLNKKLENFVRDYGKTTEEKKLKKIPEEIVSVIMRQFGHNLLKEFPDTSILGDVVSKCGETEHEMAQFQANYDARLEHNVLLPLQTMMEDDYDAIQKNMRTLQNLAMKVDLAKSKYKDSQDKLHKYFKTPVGDPERERELREKLSQADDEVEMATQNMEQFKDTVATSLLAFVNKETETSEKLMDLLIIQRDYHYSCYRQIDELLPILRDRIKDYSHKPVYGLELKEHLRVTGREIAVPLEECSSAISEIGLVEEGLLRIPGSNSRIKRIIAAFNYPGQVDWDYFSTDVHSIGGALKQYFRDLPEPLLTFSLYDAWIECAQELQSRTSDDGVFDPTPLVALLEKLPRSNFVNLRYLVKFLVEVSKSSDVNKMTPTNLAIVMGGNLLWRNVEDASALRHTPLKNLLVETFISHHEKLFPDFKFSPNRLLKHETLGETIPPSNAPSALGVSALILGAPANHSNSAGPLERESSPFLGGPGREASASTNSARGVKAAGSDGAKPNDNLYPNLLKPMGTLPRKSVKQRPAPHPGSQDSRPLSGPPNFPPPSLPLAKKAAEAENSAPAVPAVQASPAISIVNGVDTAEISLVVGDAPDGVAPPAAAAEPAPQPRPRKLPPTGEKPPVAREAKPALPVESTPSDSIRPPRPASKPPLASNADKSPQPGGRPPPRPMSGPPPPPPNKPSNNEDAFTHL